MHSDLDRAFSAGARLETAQRIFTDRVSEQAAFDTSIDWYQHEIVTLQSEFWNEQDLQRPRRNALVYYGVGGIGKSSLIRVLHDRIGAGDLAPKHWPTLPPSSADLHSVTYDLRAVGDPSLESLLLAIRSGLALIQIPCTAFDALLTRYWQQVHPGESLGEYLQKNSRLRRWAATVGLPDQVETAVGDVAAELGSISAVGSSVARATKATVTAIRANRRVANALDRCRLLGQLLSAAPDTDSLAYYAHALAWDLAEAQRRRPVGLIVFVDTFEDTPPGLEEHLQRVVWLMPNVLFVIAGRDRLRWADAARADATHFRQGADHWPGLAPSSQEDPKQHLVGFLSDSDGREYLSASLSESKAVDSVLIDVIIDRARGLPIHLDLAVDRVLTLADRGEIGYEELDLSFPELAARTLRDLTIDQRRAVLAACMFDAFDVELVRATAGLEQSGAVLKLVERSLVDDSSALPLPYAVHDVLREALLQTGSLGEDSWSAHDFHRAGGRALAELRRRWNDGTSDRAFLLQQALRVARSYGNLDPWLPEAADDVTSRSNWSPSWSAPRIETAVVEDESRTWVDALADGISVVMRRQSLKRDDVAARLHSIISEAPDSSELDLLRYFQAEALRDSGEIDEARGLLDQLGEADGSLKARALHAHLHLLRREGFFVEVQGILGANQGLHTHDRLLGDLLWTQALFDEAATAYRAGIAAANQRGDQGEAFLCAVSEAFAQAFLHPAQAAANLTRVINNPANTPFVSFATQLANVAHLLIVANDPYEARNIEEVVRQESEAIGHTSIRAYVTLASLIGSCIRGDDTRAASLIQDLTDQVRGRMFEYVLDIGETVIEGEAVPTPRADWTDGALARWTMVVPERRKALV